MFPARTLPGKGGEAPPLPHQIMSLQLSCLCVLIYFSTEDCDCYSVSPLSVSGRNWIRPRDLDPVVGRTGSRRRSVPREISPNAGSGPQCALVSAALCATPRCSVCSAGLKGGLVQTSSLCETAVSCSYAENSSSLTCTCLRSILNTVTS